MPLDPNTSRRPAASVVGKSRVDQSLHRTPNPDSTDPNSNNPDNPLLAVPAGVPDLGDTYEVRKELGRGGMGTVYLARNTVMDRLEVVKVMNAEIAAKPGVAERFLKEIQAAARLEHPNVVTAYTTLRPAGGLALAMAYVDGLDLDKLVKANGPLSLLRACNYVAQAARGLEHAREAGLTHRDIKPSNLMATRIKSKTVVKVLDFGLAKFKGGKDAAGLTHSGQMMGTPAYIAPEQAMDASKADTRADVYSLGCTLYFLIAGRPPFEGTVMSVLAAHALTAPTPLPDVRPEVPADLWAVIARMMAKNPVDRHQSPGEVERALIPFIKPGAGQASAGQPVVRRLPAQPLVDESVLEYEPPPLELIVGPKPAVRSGSPWLIPGLALAFVGLAVVVFFGVKVMLKTPEGTLVVEVNEPGAEVLIDGTVVQVTGADGKPVSVSVRPGTHAVEVRKDGFAVVGEAGTPVVVEDGKALTIRARLEAVKGEASDVRTEPAADPSPQIPPSDRTDAPPRTESKPETPGELIVNGYCDEGSLRGWVIVSGKWYGSREGSGNYHFCAGDCSFGVMKQVVDVSRYAADIDAGQTTFHVSGRMHSYKASNQKDRARITFEFLDGSSKVLKTAYDTGDRYEPDRWATYSDSCLAQAGTRAVRVTISSTRSNGKGNVQNSGYLDDISLKAVTRKAVAVVDPLPVGSKWSGTKRSRMPNGINHGGAEFTVVERTGDVFVAHATWTCLEWAGGPVKRWKVEGKVSADGAISSCRYAGPLDEGSKPMNEEVAKRWSGATGDGSVTAGVFKLTFRYPPDDWSWEVEMKPVPDSGLQKAEQSNAGPVVVATWMHRGGNDPGTGRKVKIYSNGKLDSHNNASTWEFKEGTITLRWAVANVPGGYWVDVCRLHTEGTRYSGKNQIGTPIEGTKLCDGDIDAK